MKNVAHERTRSAGLVAGVIAALARPGINAGIIRLETTDTRVIDRLTDDLMAIGETLRFRIEPFELTADLLADATDHLAKTLAEACSGGKPILFVLTDYGGDASRDALARLIGKVRQDRRADRITGMLVITRRSIGDMGPVLDAATGRSGLPYDSAVIE